ncbi:hypothetical protein Zmor_014405 [Zophobas morio]|uniref:Uncharacterized protein n=1 Tax=Zophobas morio TaxID=2755281 RepID=A0AA38MGV1_9CUCU|nr:hypothetical protein Zmor_014405 [Zophobas morio]
MNPYSRRWPLFNSTRSFSKPYVTASKLLRYPLSRVPFPGISLALRRSVVLRMNHHRRNKTREFSTAIGVVPGPRKGVFRNSIDSHCSEVCGSRNVGHY